MWFEYYKVKVSLLYLMAMVNAAKLNCEELMTPRTFGGLLKHSEYASVAVSQDGDILAGGYSRDESLIIEELRTYVDEMQI